MKQGNSKTDFFSLKDDIKIAILNKVIDLEFEKPIDECDFDLIEDYSELINLIRGNEIPSFIENEEELYKKLIDTWKKEKAGKTDSADKPFKEHIPIAKRKSVRAAIILAAIIGALLVGATVAVAFGFNPFAQYGVDFPELPANKPVSIENTEIEKGDGAIFYDSLEEMIEDKGYNISYPKEIFAEQEFTEIRVIEYKDETEISISFKNGRLKSYLVLIYNEPQILHHSSYEYNGIEYLVSGSEPECFVNFVIGNYRYVASFETSESAYEAIKQIKK